MHKDIQKTLDSVAHLPKDTILTKAAKFLGQVNLGSRVEIIAGDDIGQCKAGDIGKVTRVCPITAYRYVKLDK